MKNALLLLLAATLSLLFLPATSNASPAPLKSRSYQTTVTSPASGHGADVYGSLRRFDPALGTLVGIRFSLQAGGLWEHEGDSTSSSTPWSRVETGSYCKLKVNDFIFGLGTLLDVSGSNYLDTADYAQGGAGDSACDWAGTGHYVSVLPLDALAGNGGTDHTDATLLANWTGSGARSFTVSDDGNTTVGTTGANTCVDWRMGFSAKVTVTYFYS